MKTSFLAALVALLIGGVGAVSHAGPTGPFPGAHTIATPFPWSSINGMWETNDNSTGTQFSFDVLRDTNGTRILHVTQFDSRGDVLAEGIGYQNASSQNMVEVYMHSPNGGPDFEVILRSFANTDTGKRFNVMTVGPTTPSDVDVLQRVNPK